MCEKSFISALVVPDYTCKKFYYCVCSAHMRGGNGDLIFYQLDSANMRILLIFAGGARCADGDYYGEYCIFLR